MLENTSYKVLLTNVWLASRGGSEICLRDLALGLQRRGHRPIVYSPMLGEVSDEIRARGIPVVDDLRRVAEPPDIIHGHHLVPTAEALIHFPKIPAIHVSHAWEFWVERPPKFPQIQLYAAVSETIRDRLVHEEGIDPEKVVLSLNAVDLVRVPTRHRPLSPTLRRAICFTSGKAHVPILRAACEQMGVDFDTLGRCGDRMSSHPESELVNYDLVFATGRSAIEALCCGAAVVVCDDRGLGGYVNTENYDRFRRLNFALRSLTKTVSVENIAVELEQYRAQEAALVAQRASAEASLDLQLDRFLDIYNSVLMRWPAEDFDLEASRKAMLDFLHDALPRRVTDLHRPWMAAREHLIKEQDRIEREFLARMGFRTAMSAAVRALARRIGSGWAIG
jgi:Glycosyltransferase Family 4